MDSILSAFTEFCGCFIDDIVIFSSNLQEHLDHVITILKQLSKFNFRIKIEKCKFGFSEVAMLGHIVGCGVIKPDVAKLNDVWKVDKPKTGKALQSFLGTINYLRSYIPRFSNLAKPLYAIKNIKGNLEKAWGVDQDRSFETLKSILKFKINLHIPNFNSTFYVGTDASNHGIGGVLYQKEIVNGQDIPKIICIVSKSLSKAQQNYAITKKELWAVVYCLSKFHDWVVGRHFVLETDHQAITHLFKGNQENVVLNSWLHILLKYDFEVVHIPGIEHIFPDNLSRLMADSWMNKEVGHEESCKRIAAKVSNKVEGNNQRMKSRVASSDVGKSVEPDGDREFPKASTTLMADLRAPSEVRISNPGVELARFIKQRLDKDTLPFEERTQFVKDVHIALGHCSANALFNEIWRRGYFWESLFRECKTFTGTCLDCLRINIKKHGYTALQSMEANAPFQTIAIDWMHLNEDVGDKKRVLVVKDVCTSFIIMKSMTKFTSEHVAQELLQIFSNFGVPQVIKTDPGSEFSSKFFKSLCEELKILKLEGTPHHQQSNPVEASIRELQRIFAKIVPATDKENYDRYVPIVQMMMNSRTHSSHQCKPFELMFNRKFDTTGFQQYLPNYKDAERWKDYSQNLISLLFPLVNEKITNYRDKYKKKFDSSNRIVEDIVPGTLVMIKNHQKKKGKKLEATFLGPFIVKTKNPYGTYEITTMEGVNHQSRVARDAIKVIQGNIEQFSKEFEIERIVNHRKKKNGEFEFLIKWLGYNLKHNLWLPVQNLVGLEIFDAYIKNNKIKI